MISDFSVKQLQKVSVAESVRNKHAEIELKLRQKLAESKKLRVVFLVVHEGIWKYDSLFEKMRDSEDFEPLILVCPYTIDKPDVIHKNLNSTFEYFSRKNYQVHSSWVESAGWIDVSTLKPDLVFFTYPHSLTLDKYYTDVFMNYICVYGGYGVKTADYGEGQDQYNQLFHNVMWKTYVSSERDFSVFNRLSAVKRKAVEFAGECNVETLYLRHKGFALDGQNTDRKKLIIWAPHHTITESWFPLATFLKNHDFFQKLANRTEDLVDWVFKPHPALKAKLYRHPDWGVARTEKYFKFWSEQKNTKIQEGDYIDLFVESDAMILDSATFVGEYHFVDKPMLYLMNEGAYKHFTELGRDALEACDIAYDINQIEKFVQKIVDGIDTAKEKRKFFLEKYNRILGGKFFPSENIMRSIRARLGVAQLGKKEEEPSLTRPEVTVFVVLEDTQEVSSCFLDGLINQTEAKVDLVVFYTDTVGLNENRLESLMQGRMTFERVRFEPGKLQSAMQACLKNTKNDYVTFLEGYEKLLPSCFSEQAVFLSEHPDAVAVAGRVQVLAGAGQNGDCSSSYMFDNPHREILAQPLVPLNSLLIRRSALVGEGLRGIETGIHHGLMCSLLLQGDLGFIHRVHKWVDEGSYPEAFRFFSNDKVAEYIKEICFYVENVSLSQLTGVEDLTVEEEADVLLGLACFMRLLDNHYFGCESLGAAAADKLVRTAKAKIDLSAEKLSFLKVPVRGSLSIRAMLTDECVQWFGDLLPFIDGFADKKLLSVYREASILDWLEERRLSSVQSKVFKDSFVSSQKTVTLFMGAVEEKPLNLSAKAINLYGNFLDIELVDCVKGRGFDFVNKLNTSMARSQSNWISILQKQEELIDSGLLMAQIELMQNPNLSAISFDEIYRQEDGSLGAAFRPSGNLDYLLSFPAGMSRHWLFNRKALLDIGGFNPDLPDAFELDAILRLINKGGLECIGHIPEPLVITPSPVLANVEDERKAILSHLAERGYANAELHAPNPGRYQIRYNHPGQPVVSVVLAAGNNLSALQRCVEGLLGNTSYQNFEILFIEQPNSGVEVKEWLAGLAAMQEPKLRVFASKEKTLSRQYNEVQAQAIGDYLLFLSPTTSVVSEHWLDEMLNHAQRGEVGVVGAKLLTPGGEIAHAGYILGLEGPVGAPFVGDPMDAAGYMQRLQVDQNLSAVGGDCMMVLRELFVQVDGFADGELVDEYLSTDLCLRAREAGFLVVWTPHAQLMLDKEQTALPTAEQQDVMYEKWLPQLARDPAYNPNFSLSMPGGFKLADSQISWRPLDGIRPAPVALVHPADLAGCGHYRVMQPFLAMKGEGLVDGAISTGLMHVTDLERYNPDCIVLQRQIGDARLEAMQRMQKFSRAFKVYELDDYLPNLPLKSVHRKDMPKDILRSLRRGLGFVDRFVVSTPALAEAFAGLHGEIVVRENRLPLSWWDGLQTQRRQGKKPRVGWAGGSSHTGDLELIADVVRDLADEVEWVFFGMCPEALKPYVHEFHGGVAIEEYPAKLASLNLDLGLAPLEHNLFNECKSNLRQLEYGACGIPIICTDIRPYQDGQQAGLPVTLVKNRYKDWVDAIRMHINDLDATAKMADELQTRVKADWMLQGEHLLQWRDAWVGR